jgi:TPR repeat protein
MCYDTAPGTPKDYVQAYKWFNLAAALADQMKERALRDVAMSYRNSVAAKMTAAQIAEAQKLTRAWTPMRGK